MCGTTSLSRESRRRAEWSSAGTRSPPGGAEEAALPSSADRAPSSGLRRSPRARGMIRRRRPWPRAHGRASSPTGRRCRWRALRRRARRRTIRGRRSSGWPKRCASSSGTKRGARSTRCPTPTSSSPSPLRARAGGARARRAREGAELLQGLESRCRSLAKTCATSRGGQAARRAVRRRRRLLLVAARRRARSSTRRRRSTKAKDAGRARVRSTRRADERRRARRRPRRARCACGSADKRRRRRGAIADARWLSVHAPDPRPRRGAEALPRADPTHPLTADGMDDARVRADGGGFINEAFARSIDTASARRAARTSSTRSHAREGRRALPRARALPRGRRSSKSAPRSGASTPRRTPSRRARALARRPGRRGDPGVRRVERRYPKTQWADQASFLVPRLHILHGDGARRRAASTTTCGASAGRRAARRGAKPRDRASDGRGLQRGAEALRAARRGRARSDRLRARAHDGGARGARDGDRTHAVARWTDVARSRPLT